MGAAARIQWRSGAGVVALLVVLQLPLLLDPGYLGADELQWWARADVAGVADLPWVSWTDLGAFQYRPLTFNLWLLAAHAFAAHARAMHALFVAAGTINALLLAQALRAFGARGTVAVAAAAVFVLSPFAAYTHGWTGTLGDLLVLMFGLLGVLAVAAQDARAGPRAVTLAGLTVAALLAKESALVLPLLWAGVAAARIGVRRAAAITAPAAALVAAYLIARAPVLWSVDPTHAAYAWRVANVVPRLGEYLLFAWLPPLFEIGPTFDKGALRLVAAAACAAATLLALSRAGWNHALAWMLLGVIALAPVLVLGQSFNQYGYLAAATAVGIGAHAWDRCPPAARRWLLASVAIACVHGVLIMLRMREVGAIEQRFHADLRAQLQRNAAPLHVVSARAADAWMLARWVDDVPSYRGVAIAGRATARAAPSGAAQATMRADGSLLVQESRSE